MSFIIKDLKSNRIESKNYININNFFPKGLKKIIRSIPDNYYILGVGYVHGDNQVCISGHPKKNETIYEGLKRELKEELYIVLKKDINYLFQYEENYFFKININQVDINTEYIENNEKDSKERVIVCVYGTELEIFKYMIELGDYNLNNDGINSVWASSKEKILKIIN